MYYFNLNRKIHLPLSKNDTFLNVNCYIFIQGPPGGGPPGPGTPIMPSPQGQLKLESLNSLVYAISARLN